MEMNDRVYTRTAADLERKYDFSKMLGLTKNVEVNNTNIIKVNNTLNNMLTSLIINLRDVLGSQADISLWFYQGIPTTSNSPYTEWTNPADHIGDFYYDQNSGNVYKYTTDGWTQITDTTLIEALALTNVDIDVSTDHERTVYMVQPTPPYQSGDWWILEDGSLKICQLGKGAGEEYDVNDFVVSTKYTSTIATKQGDTITVLKGTVTEITENYVKYTDLATGGSTTIAGENINTGNITSNNYVPNTSGTKISLNDGTINSKNFKVLSNGDLDIGGYIKTTKGILTNLQFKSAGINDFTNYAWLGFNVIADGGGLKAMYADLSVEVEIPDNFEITSAYLTLYHTPISWADNNNISLMGWSRDVKVYRAKDGVNETFQMAYLSNYYVVPISNANLVEVATIGTPTIHTGTKVEAMPKVDIKSCLKAGSNRIVVRSATPVPTSTTSTNEACSKTGIARCIVNILGYMKVS